MEHRECGVQTRTAAGRRRCPAGRLHRAGRYPIANAEAQAALAASRARIVAAAEATRRRIERDLHDGAWQRLVSLALQKRAAQAAPPEADELVQQLEGAVTEATGVLEELREIACGIHPAVLTEYGLRPALGRWRTAPPSLSLDVRVVERLPGPVEVAAYFAVSEALTNAAMHAHASPPRSRWPSARASCGSASATTDAAAPTSPTGQAWPG